MNDNSKENEYPICASITEEQLIHDPYTICEELRRSEPISWIKKLSMWYVVDYESTSNILMNDKLFVTSSENSTIYDALGKQILSVDGVEHRHYKLERRPPLRPNAIRKKMETQIEALANQPIDTFSSDGQAERRSKFARRLPVQTMLFLFGLPADDESNMRRWYDSFERALANFKWNDAVRETAHTHVAEFHEQVYAATNRVVSHPDHSPRVPLYMRRPRKD